MTPEIAERIAHVDATFPEIRSTLTILRDRLGDDWELDPYVLGCALRSKTHGSVRIEHPFRASKMYRVSAEIFLSEKRDPYNPEDVVLFGKSVEIDAAGSLLSDALDKSLALKAGLGL